MSNTAPTSTAPIAPGAHIVVRDAVWRVLQVNRTRTGGASWRVVGISEIVRDQEAVFLEAFEQGVEVLDPTTTGLSLDVSPGHRDSRLYMESLLRDVPPTGPELHIGHTAAMDVLPYQLEPARLALGKLRQRILIADAVGLGKTLEAGILLSELVRRGRGKRILVATVKSMLTQFQKEMWARFSLPLVRLDSQGLTRIRHHIPTNHNPFYHFDKVIISIDTLKQNNQFRTHVEQAHWDVIVIDEAHNVAARGGGRSQRAAIAEVLAERCDAMILLSATPHDGKARSFASLMNMLDPTAIANPDAYTRADIEGLFVRRFKKDVHAQLSQAFPERILSAQPAEASAEEEAVFDALAGLQLTYFAGVRDGGMLFKTSLEKALFSSPQACAMVLTAPLRRKGVRELLPKDFFPRRDQETRKPAAILAQALPHLSQAAASDKDLAPLVADVTSLANLATALDDVTPAVFSKYQKLLRVIKGKKHFAWKASKKDDRLVIFSERIETLKFLEDQLTADLKLKPGQVKLLHGGLSDRDQQAIVEEFGKLKATVRILLASDVASEGLNLHYLCHRLVHFDIPWSLMVFQQRNGRVDRYGQEKQPHIVYMHTKAQNEVIAGDARILELLIERDKQVGHNIGDPAAVMGTYDIEAEELLTANAIENNLGAAGFAAQLDLEDPLGALFDDDDDDDDDGVTMVHKQPISLFASDHAYVQTALERLGSIEQLRFDAHDDVLEITMPPDNAENRRSRAPGLDLRRRFGKLPAEVMPKDGVVVLSSARDKVQKAIAEARREEHAWPRLQFLWPLHPVVTWVGDKGRAIYGRHTAPVMTLLDGLDPSEAIVVVSGLIPNRRSQPLLHRWYAVRFRGGKLDVVEDFGDCLRRLQLVSRKLTNRSVPADLEALKALIAPAVDGARREMVKRQQVFSSDTDLRRAAELSKLRELKDKQLAALGPEPIAKPNAQRKHAQRRRRIERIFASYETWAHDALTSEPVPFVQVIAVLRPEQGFGGVA